MKRSTPFDADNASKERRVDALFHLPRGVFAEREQSLVPAPASPKGATHRLPRPEFTRRQRYRDSNGNAYAPALESDALYVSLASHNLVDPLDPLDAQRAASAVNAARGLPRRKRRNVVDQSGTRGTYYGRALFYVEMKADGKVHRWPRGDVEFVDPNTEQLFTGTVVKSIFRGRAKGGYVILHDVVGWGRMSDPRDFSVADANDSLPTLPPTRTH